jgi:molybdopterin converting factor subunit 1
VNVEIKLFAVAKQLAGSETVAVRIPNRATVQELRDAIGQQHTELHDITERALIAIDAEYVNNDAIVPERSEIALIPPVSGG